MKKSFFLIVLMALLVACDQQSPLYISIQNAQGGNVIGRVNYVTSQTPTVFHIRSEAKDAQISRLSITSSDSYYGNLNLFDSVYNSGISMLNFAWNYTSPYYPDITFVTLHLDVRATKGNQQQQVFSVYVIPVEKQEIRKAEMVSLYTIASNRESTFNMQTLSTSFTGLEPDSLYNIYDMLSTDSTKLDSPSCSWETSNNLFVADGGSFDYGNATSSSIQNAYYSSLHRRTLTGIQQDDIILVGTQSQAIGVIKVVAIFDETGTNNDRYLLDVKSLLPAQ